MKDKKKRYVASDKYISEKAERDALRLLNLRRCPKCKGIKPFTDFNKGNTKDGTATECKVCSNIRSAKWNKSENGKVKTKEYKHSAKYKDKVKRDYRANKDKILDNNKAYRIAHKEELRAKRELNKESASIRAKEYYIKNKERIAIKSKEYYDSHKDKRRETSKKWREKNKDKLEIKRIANKDKIRERKREYSKNKEQTDLAYKLIRRLRARIYEVLKRRKKGSGFYDLLGCSREFLLQYIESLFIQGMSWGNYGFGVDKWHLDHIRPCASFDLTDYEQQKECFHYSNLQPLWQQDNLSKGKKYIK